MLESGRGHGHSDRASRFGLDIVAGQIGLGWPLRLVLVERRSKNGWMDERMDDGMRDMTRTMRRKDVEQWGVRAGHEKCIQSVDSDNSDARRISVEPTREGKRATGTYSTVHPRPNHQVSLSCSTQCTTNRRRSLALRIGSSRAFSISLKGKRFPAQNENIPGSFGIGGRSFKRRLTHGAEPCCILLKKARQVSISSAVVGRCELFEERGGVRWELLVDADDVDGAVEEDELAAEGSPEEESIVLIKVSG